MDLNIALCVHLKQWSRKRGEAKQMELIGITEAAEIDVANLTNYNKNYNKASAEFDASKTDVPNN